MKRVSLLIVLLALALLVAPQASATVYNLADGNSTLKIDSGSEAGAYGWVVDGTSVLYQQWFWYRIGSTGGEQSIDNLGLLSANVLDASDLRLTYGSTTGLEVSVLYSLTGGSVNSHMSDTAETILIKNNGSTSLDVHFFQYSDFDLASDLIDKVAIDPSLQKVVQRPVGSGPILSETVVTPAPQHAEANYYSNTLGKLNDGLPTTLDDVLTAGPGDVTWAFEWDKMLAGGGSFLISKDKNLAPMVPEPAPLALLGGVLVVLARKFRRCVV
jgi:hypothetical protein